MGEEKQTVIRKDHKVRLMGIALWYLICLVPCFLFAVLFIGRSTTENFWLWRFAFAFGVAAVAELVIYLVVFPYILGGTRKQYNQIISRIASEGYTPQVIGELELLLSKCMESKNYSSYRDGCCKYLTEAYAMRKEFDTALRYHAMSDTDFMFRYHTLSFQRDQALWHGQLIQIYAMKGDVSASEQCFSRAQSFLNSIHGNDIVTDYFIDLSVFEYYLAIGDYAACERLAEPYKQHKEFRSSAFRSLARMYAKKGDTAQARQCFDIAIESAGNQFIREFVQSEKNRVLGQNI